MWKTLVIVGLSFSLIAKSVPETPSLDKLTKKRALPYGRLQAKGNRIVGDDGKPVSMAGMSLFWSQWIGKYYTPEVVKFLRDDFRSPIIRAAIAAENGGYDTQPEVEFQRACTVIDAAIANHMYVIVDWHSHTAEKHPERAVEFFSKISKKYGKNDHILYEIYNEPLQVSWSNVIKPYAEKVIAAIRKNDPDNLIIVGTPTWSQDVDAVIPDPIRDPNVAYTLHFYAATHKQFLRDKAQKALDAGLALFVTEWGTVPATGDGPMDRASTLEWLEFMRKNQLSHLNWSVADKRESAAILVPGASVKGGWTVDDYTESGMFVRNVIRNWQVPR